jgi:hypothetical protein
VPIIEYGLSRIEFGNGWNWDWNRNRLEAELCYFVTVLDKPDYIILYYIACSSIICVVL